MRQSIMDELAARIANVAIENLSPDIVVSFRDDQFGGKEVVLELKITSALRVSREAMLFEGRGSDVAAVLGMDLAMRLKEQVVKYASTVCLKSQHTMKETV